MIKLLILRSRHYDIRDLTKLRRRRQLQKAIGLVSKTTILHEHHAFLYISLPSLHDYDVKWPNFKVFWEQERQGDKFCHLCLNSGAAPSLQLYYKFPSLNNWATWDNREMVCKDAESISARGFHERSRCRIVRTTAISFSRQNDVAWFTREQNSVLGKSRTRSRSRLRI